MELKPFHKFENGVIWHSWDGSEWWNGEPNAATRSLSERSRGVQERIKILEHQAYSARFGDSA
jgi:hypothetical protein